MRDFDVIIIGTGSGNTIITPEFDDLNVAIIEKGTFGGTCLNRGCIPSKMLIYVADVITEITRSTELGITTENCSGNWQEIQERIFSRIDPIASAGEDYRQNLPNIYVFNGEASFISGNEIIVNDEIIRGKQIVVATGATPAIPEIDGLSKIQYHTSDTIMRIAELPKRLGIIGGGYIAVELAHVFSSFGCEVTMLVRGNTLLSKEDFSIRKRFNKAFQGKVDLRFGASVSKIYQDKNSIQLDFEDETLSVLEVDELLLATGRLPDLESLNVQAANIDIKDGYIVTDQYMRTSTENIWALGDVTNPAQLKHTANAEAKIVSHNLINKHLKRVDLDPTPHAIFSNPQVASVGYTEQEIMAAGMQYVVAVEEYGDVAYGWAMEEKTGICKVIADPKTGLLIGAHILGPQASTLIHQLIQGMKFGQTVAELASGFLYVHPALNEVVENALIKVASLCN
tara:strand:+ start:3351 stop:4715 length:1365 start_codon:yes stop_codon:yes gene_type:complete